MNKEEKVQYLANVYYVLLADGQVERIEERAFEDIARDIGAGYFERRDAMERAQQPDCRVQPMGRWSEQIRNLEDMLFAAYCNGVLDQAEKTAVKQYAAQLGIDQKQLSQIVSQTKARYAAFQDKSK